MKTVFVNRQRVKLFGIPDLARALNVSHQAIRYRIAAQTLPAPTFVSGARFYYTEADYLDLVKPEAETIVAN